MKTTEDIMNVVLVVLSIGTVIGPVLFGFILFRMTSIFVTKTQFDDYKLLQQVEQQHIISSLNRIERMISKP